MKTRLAIAIIVTAASLGGIAQATISRLDRETAKQCASQDWPLRQAAAHRDFCRAYGYPMP